MSLRIARTICRLSSLIGVWAGMFCIVTGAVARPDLTPGDIVIGSRTNGSIYGPVKPVGQTTALISGPDLSNTMLPVRGLGISAVGPHLSLLAVSPSQILARAAGVGLISVDVATGDRILLPGTNSTEWMTGGDMVRFDEGSIVAVADDFLAALQSNGRLLRYDLAAGTTTLISGGSRGDGVVMNRPRCVALMGSAKAAVAEFGGNAAGSQDGALIYEIDLVSGDRRVISSPGDRVPLRYVASFGVVSEEPVKLASFPIGTGPVVDGFIRGMVWLNEKLYICGSLASPYPPFVIEVDPTTGNRTLIGGTAIVNGSRVTVPFGAGSTTVLPDAPCALLVKEPGTLAMSGVFEPNRVWQLDVQSRRLTIIANLNPQIHSSLRADVKFSGLTIVPNRCEIHPSVPQVAQQPAEASVCESSVGGFSVSPSGASPFTFQWRRNGTPIDPVENPSALTSTLSITDAIAGDAGMYDCVISNQCGSIITQPARLIVVPDYNADGIVNTPDLTFFLGRFAQPATPGSPAQRADFNADGVVGTPDLVYFLARFGVTCP
ncbi:MAG: immunoglobulin domain-containing protein [Phycisphaerales bacterium]